MSTELYLLIGISIMAAVTAFLRAVPFLIFGEKRKVPAYITRLSSLLPYAVMAILVVYCLRNINFLHVSGFLPELICTAIVIVLHLWKHNTIFSIVTGTICYMLLVQMVFV